MVLLCWAVRGDRLVGGEGGAQFLNLDVTFILILRHEASNSPARGPEYP